MFIRATYSGFRTQCKKKRDKRNKVDVLSCKKEKEKKETKEMPL